MPTKVTLTKVNSIYSDLTVVKELVYYKCGFELTNLKQNLESEKYGACSFELNGKLIQHRVSNITANKTGQFVSIWKRNKDGITMPFDIFDNVDFIIISSKSENNFGQFIFPKTVLADHGIITSKGKEGKRGIRVYPPWTIAKSRQAEKTQSWQIKYFLAIKNDCSTDLLRAKQLLMSSD